MQQRMYKSPWKQNTAEVATLISEVGQLEKKTGTTVQEYLSQGSFKQKYSFLFFTYYICMHRLIYS